MKLYTKTVIIVITFLFISISAGAQTITGKWNGQDIKKVLKGIDDIAFCRLNSRDVVRHPLVQRIVKAYEVYESKEDMRKRKKDGRSSAFGRK
mgnify:CR=1 FL=1